jgi:hypothetical protein
MCCGPSGNHPHKISGGYCVGIGAANTQRRLLRDPAGTHAADSTTYPLLAEAALRRLALESVPYVFMTGLGHQIYHFLRRLVGATFFCFHKMSSLSILDT